jgi:hypothetical protein
MWRTEVRFLDQDREIFKLQVAAQHYESSYQTSLNVGLGFMLAVAIFALGLTLELLRLGYAWYNDVLSGVFLVTGAGLLVYFIQFRNASDCYNEDMKKLDQHLQNLEKGQTAPSLKELLGECNKKK